MAKRRRTKTLPKTESFLLGLEAPIEGGPSWFVYLFALADCSAFKAGMSCNPLQRICTFNRRFFERFDLRQSVLVELPTCDAARELEFRLKSEFLHSRSPAPEWVPIEAGGHTEWFSAVYFADAEDRVRSSVNPQLPVANAFDLFRLHLQSVSRSFEPWAIIEAQRSVDAWALAQRGYRVRDQSNGLRDWIDAYHYFDIPLFADAPESLEFVREAIRAVRT